MPSLIYFESRPGKADWTVAGFRNQGEEQLALDGLSLPFLYFAYTGPSSPVVPVSPPAAIPPILQDSTQLPPALNNAPPHPAAPWNHLPASISPQHPASLHFITAACIPSSALLLGCKWSSRQSRKTHSHVSSRANYTPSLTMNPPRTLAELRQGNNENRA